MPSPFPGMNPYLEHPELWSEVHHRLITAIADAIAPAIRPKYRAAIEKRTYLSSGEDTILVGIPDVSIYSQRLSTKENATTITLPVQSEAIAVTIPMPQEVRQGYIEIREVETGDVIAAIEVLSW